MPGISAGVAFLWTGCLVETSALASEMSKAKDATNMPSLAVARGWGGLVYF